METNRLVTYRPETWDKLSAILDGYSAEKLDGLFELANINTADINREKALETLINEHGWLVMISTGLVTDPEVMNRSVFSLGGLEYVLSRKSAAILSNKAGTAPVEVLGGGKSRSFTYSDLMKALSESQDFDQMVLR